MTKQVLILGGRGRIGGSVATDLIQHTQVGVTITGRSPQATTPLTNLLGDRVQYLAIDLADQSRLSQAIGNADLVIHCAGPFRYRDTTVLKTCIEQGVNYLDVSDDRSFTQKALALRSQAQSAGITAIVNSGVFPGISNSMVRQGVERFDKADQIHLSYVVAGSGGAGITVMRTTFLGLQNPFKVWREGQWQEVQPYTDREIIDFPQPFGKSGVYWFDMPEAFTLAEAFPVQTVITKFGSVPDLYNHLTWIAAHKFPTALVRQKGMIEFLARVSYIMTSVSDRFSGIGVAMRAEVRGQKQGKSACYCSTFAHDNTAIVAGNGTGSLADFLLSGQIRQPGVWTVEEALPTALFEQAMMSRGLVIHQGWQ